MQNSTFNTGLYNKLVKPLPGKAFCCLFLLRGEGGGGECFPSPHQRNQESLREMTTPKQFQGRPLFKEWLTSAASQVWHFFWVTEDGENLKRVSLKARWLPKT